MAEQKFQVSHKGHPANQSHNLNKRWKMIIKKQTEQEVDV
jgi:hypothetical protein